MILRGEAELTKIRCIRTTIKAIDTRTCRPPPKKADAELLTPEHRRWAEEVKRRAGYQCEWVDNGKRCEVRAPARLFADHPVERRDGGSLTGQEGRCYCGSHHTRKTAAARAARMAEKF